MPPPAATQAAARLWTARVTNPPHLPCITQSVESMTPPAVQARFTRGCIRELKNSHNSVTVQNQTHVYVNFFHHKGLGNHLLQLCPKVVKHPVYYMCLVLSNLLTCSISNCNYLQKLNRWTEYVCMYCEQNAVQNCNIKTAIKSFQNVTHLEYLWMTPVSPYCMYEEVKSRFSSGNVCYIMIQNLLCSWLLSKNIIWRLKHREL